MMIYSWLLLSMNEIRFRGEAPKLLCRLLGSAPIQPLGIITFIFTASCHRANLTRPHTGALHILQHTSGIIKAAGYELIVRGLCWMVVLLNEY